MLPRDIKNLYLLVLHCVPGEDNHKALQQLSMARAEPLDRDFMPHRHGVFLWRWSLIGTSQAEVEGSQRVTMWSSQVLGSPGVLRSFILHLPSTGRCSRCGQEQRTRLMSLGAWVKNLRQSNTLGPEPAYTKAF